jgi:uncharacterized peroxidase-related enzyme
MSYLHEIAYDGATGQLRELYDTLIKEYGYIPHHRSVFSLRLDVLISWVETTRLIRSHMRLRPFELVTLAASVAIGCKYCILAHGATLARNGFSEDRLISIIVDFHQARLEPVEVHMMDLARKLSTDPRLVSAKDIQTLREDGLTEEEISDVALVAAERNFYSRYYDALGTEPDPQLKNEVPRLWEYVMEVAFGTVV